MNIHLWTVPTEAVGQKLIRGRSEGHIPITPKLAINYLAKWMERNGYHDYTIYDTDMLYPDDEEIANFLARNRPDVVGLSAVVSTSYQQVKRFARLIRISNPNAYIVAGGYVTSAASVLLRKTDVDLCVVGDGEIAWVELLNHLTSCKVASNKVLATIQGLAFINDRGDLVSTGYGKQINKKDIPYVDYELLKKGLDRSPELINNYFRNGKTANLFSFDERISDNTRGEKLAFVFLSKGCVAKCTFCQRFTKGYRVFDDDKLDAHLEMLKRDYNVGYIVVGDENFGSNRKHSYEIAQLFQKHNLLWAAAGVRCTSITRDDVKFYKNHNCTSLKFGVESGSQKMLDLMEKRFEVQDIEQGISYCNDAGLLSPLAYMFGMPGESEETIMESGQMAGRLAAGLRVPAMLYIEAGEGEAFALPLMGTPLFEWGREVGLIGQSLDEEENFLNNTLGGSGAYKRYYVNVNGAPMSEVIFWDYLYKLEASRTCRKLMKGKVWDRERMRKFGGRTEIIEENLHTKAGKKSVRFQYISNAVQNHLLGNRLIDALPRVIIYPIIKYLLFSEYLVQRFIYQEKFPIYLNQLFETKERITEEEWQLAQASGNRSLRWFLENRMAERCEEKRNSFDDRAKQKFWPTKGIRAKGVFFNHEAEDLFRQGV